MHYAYFQDHSSYSTPFKWNCHLLKIQVLGGPQLSAKLVVMNARVQMRQPKLLGYLLRK